MQGQALRSAFRRGPFRVNRTSARLQTTTRTFSVSVRRRRDDNPPGPTSRQRSAAAASKLSALSKVASPGPWSVDARSLGAASPARSPTSSNVINIRTLRRSLPDSARSTTRPDFRGAKAGSPDGRAKRTRRPGAGNRGRRGGRKRAKDGEKDQKRDDRPRKFAFGPEEQAWVNQVEQGVTTPYTPSLTLDDLVGYGPAVATECSLGKVESAMRSLRILGGGMPFSVEGQYPEPKDVKKRLAAGSVFFSDTREKEWLAEHDASFGEVKEPGEATRAAVLETAIQGRYDAPKFAQRTDVLGTLASYHARDATYKSVDGRSFDEKVAGLLPAQAAAGRARQKAKKAAGA